MQLSPYLNFAGRCAEAFRFYEQLLGGTIEVMMTHGESPIAGQVPPEQHHYILHASLLIGEQRLLASDAPPQHFRPAQGMHVSLSVDDPAEAERIYAGLAEGATVEMPLGETFWAKRFAMLVDRFGTPWIINCA
jgi:PhnB protein